MTSSTSRTSDEVAHFAQWLRGWAESETDRGNAANAQTFDHIAAMLESLATAPVQPALTDEQIVAIRDDHLPSQGEGFDCIAFARAIISAVQPARECAKDICRWPDGDCRYWQKRAEPPHE